MTFISNENNHLINSNELSSMYVVLRFSSFSDITSDHDGTCVFIKKDIHFNSCFNSVLRCSSTTSSGAYHITSSQRVSIEHSTFQETKSLIGANVIHTINSILRFWHNTFANCNSSDSSNLCVSSYSNIEEGYSNYSFNSVGTCVSIYKEYSTNVFTLNILLAHSESQTGALIDANHATGTTTYSRIDCIWNNVKSNKYGLIYFLNNAKLVLLENICAFHNTGISIFYNFDLTPTISISNCYTDFETPHSSFIKTALTTNGFESFKLLKFQTKRTSLRNRIVIVALAMLS